MCGEGPGLVKELAKFNSGTGCLCFSFVPCKIHLPSGFKHSRDGGRHSLPVLITNVLGSAGIGRRRL
jgi:hypothetical protein